MLIGKELGPFQIESEIGSGAMGTVYKALNRQNGKNVAIKIIAMGLLGNETAVARFEHEAKILQQLKHPNIVRIKATGRYHKAPFIAMEFVDGESLDRVLARRTAFSTGAFSWEEVTAIGRQLCDALQHAHMKGIIHRDLKPSNVMVLHDGTVKLTDFGIAKDADLTALTGANSTVGTAAYMSPEQCRGDKNLTAKSDLYSLGVMFYELLTGRKPFARDTPMAMFLAHDREDFVDPSRIVLTIPQGLNALVRQLMEKKPHLRPFDAAMVGRVLTEIEEKAIEQRSAGVDLVTARRVDRPGSADDEDREAALALRAALTKTKKKVRKKRSSFPTGTALRAGGMVAVLLGMLGVLYFMTRPTPPNALYQLAKMAADSQDEERVIETTQRFIDSYPRLNDVHAQQIRNWRVQFWVVKREKQLFNRFEKKMVHDDEGQRLSNEAMSNENDGETDIAGKLWSKMETKYEATPEPEPAVYAWVARKKRDDLKRNTERVRVLLEAITAERLGVEPEHKTDTEAERLCAAALRYETFGDIAAARERWLRVRDQYLKPLDVRPWGVLAAERVQKTPTLAPGEQRTSRLKLLAQKMAEAGKATKDSDPTEKRESAIICRDIVALYGRDPDPEVGAFARQAEQKLREIGAS